MDADHAMSSHGGGSWRFDSCDDMSDLWVARQSSSSREPTPALLAAQQQQVPSLRTTQQQQQVPSLRTTQIKTCILLLTTSCTAIATFVFSVRQLATDFGSSPLPSLHLLLTRLVATANALLLALITLLYLTPGTWFGRFSQAVQVDWTLLVLMWAPLSFLLSCLNTTLTAATWTGHFAFLLAAGAVVDLPPAHSMMQLIAMLPFLCLRELIQICSAAAATPAPAFASRAAENAADASCITSAPAPAMLSQCNPRGISRHLLLQLPLCLVCLAAAAIAAQLVFSAHGSHGQVQRDEAGGTAAGAADEDPSHRSSAQQQLAHAKPSLAVPLHSLGMTAAPLSGLHRLLLSTAAVHWCERSMERLAGAGTKQLLVGCICVPAGMCFLTLGILARHNLWTRRLVSLDERDMLMLVFFLLGRESYKLDMLPSLAQSLSHLSAARAILSDLLPGHIVKLLMHQAWAGGLDGAPPEGSQGEPKAVEAAEEAAEHAVHAAEAGGEGLEEMECEIEGFSGTGHLLPWGQDVGRSSSCVPVFGGDPVPLVFAETRDDDGGDGMMFFNSMDVDSCSSDDAASAAAAAFPAPGPCGGVSASAAPGDAAEGRCGFGSALHAGSFGTRASRGPVAAAAASASPGAAAGRLRTLHVPCMEEKGFTDPGVGFSPRLSQDAESFLLYFSTPESPAKAASPTKAAAPAKAASPAKAACLAKGTSGGGWPQQRELLPSLSTLLHGSQSQGGRPRSSHAARSSSTPFPIPMQHSGTASAAAASGPTALTPSSLLNRTCSLLSRQCGLLEEAPPTPAAAPAPSSCPRSSSYQWLLGDLRSLKVSPAANSPSVSVSSPPRASSGNSLSSSQGAALKLAQSHSCLTIFFSDVCGFSTWAHSLAPEKVMDTLNDLYSRLDDIIINEMPHLYKVETIGDSYMVAGNLSSHDPAHAAHMVRFALRAQQEASKVPRPDLDDGTPLQLRIGLHSGPAMSGIVGKLRRRFCIFGDTVNMASRTETSCPPGSVQVTAATHHLALPYLGRQPGGATPAPVFRDRGELEVKGSKLPIRMYLV